MSTTDVATQPFYFTFGFESGYSKRYVRIEAADWDAARVEMFRRHGREWGFQYDAAGWQKGDETQAEKYGLTELV